MDRLVAAIDVGGTSIKAALVAEDLRVVHRTARPPGGSTAASTSDRSAS